MGLLEFGHGVASQEAGNGELEHSDSAAPGAVSGCAHNQGPLAFRGDESSRLMQLISRNL